MINCNNLTRPSETESHPLPQRCPGVRAMVHGTIFPGTHFAAVSGNRRKAAKLDFMDVQMSWFHQKEVVHYGFANPRPRLVDETSTVVHFLFHLFDIDQEQQPTAHGSPRDTGWCSARDLAAAVLPVARDEIARNPCPKGRREAGQNCQRAALSALAFPQTR